MIINSPKLFHRQHPLLSQSLIQIKPNIIQPGPLNDNRYLYIIFMIGIKGILPMTQKGTQDGGN